MVGSSESESALDASISISLFDTSALVFLPEFGFGVSALEKVPNEIAHQHEQVPANGYHQYGED
jgi:hypothetical protein